MLFVAPVLIGVLYAFLDVPAPRAHEAAVQRHHGRRGRSRLSQQWQFRRLEELVFTAAVTYFCAYRGLDSYVWIGVAWLLHTAWDALHYLRVPRSSRSPRTRRSAARSATR